VRLKSLSIQKMGGTFVKQGTLHVHNLHELKSFEGVWNEDPIGWMVVGGDIKG